LLADIEDPWLQLILAMIFENARGSQSRWSAYLNILPTSFDTLMFWSTSELQMLQGSAVVDKISREAADRTFAEQLLPIVRSNQEIFQAQALGDGDLLALCHRMGSTIMAYAFDLEKSTEGQQPPQAQDEEWEVDEEENPAKGMVPLADLLNADADRNNAKLFYQEDQVVMKTIKPVLRGEELFNDYGALPTADLVRRYGYVTPNYTRYDVVEIPADLIRSTISKNTDLSNTELDERWTYLDDQGVLDDAYDISHPPPHSSSGENNNNQGDEEEDSQPQYPDEFLILLATLTAPKETFTTLKRKSKLPKPHLEPPAHHLLTAILTDRLAMYPTDLPPAIHEENSSPIQRRREMAAQLIAGEKRVLHEAIHGLAGPARQASPVKRMADDDDGDQSRRTRVKR
jgi:SET domain-containing protein 6